MHDENSDRLSNLSNALLKEFLKFMLNDRNIKVYIIILCVNLFWSLYKLIIIIIIINS